MDDFVPCLVPPSLPTEEGSSSLSPSSVLLDDTAYISATAFSNATTAVGDMSTGEHVHVSFYLARPPRLSYMCVHFPGHYAGIPPGILPGILPGTVPLGTPAVRCVKKAPQVLCTHADLALLRVTLPGATYIRSHGCQNYFVYTARRSPGASSLQRLPHPHPHGATFLNKEVAIFRCTGTSRYVIAALSNTTAPNRFRLQRYDSNTSRWTCTLLSVHAPERHRVLPPTELLFHQTTKVITLGGPRGTIGWVDLWRGILFCDVLDAKPVLSDMPLPKPLRANRRSFGRGCPHRYRDIAVITLPCQPIKIKYIEMEIRPGVDDLPPSRQDSDSDSECDPDVAAYWNATVWTMAVPISKWKDWHKDCKVDVTDIVVDNPRHAKLLLPLPRLSTDPKTATMSLRRLLTAHPTLGLGEDGDLVIYLLSKVNYMDSKGWVIAVGARDKKLRGIAELDSRKNDSFLRCYHPTEIFKCLIKATGENMSKWGAGAIHSSQAAEETEDAGQGQQARGAGQLRLGAEKEWSRTAKNHVEPHNVCTSLQFGSFSWGMIPVRLQECNDVVFGANILCGGPLPN